MLHTDSAARANLYTQVPRVVLSLGSALDHQKKGWRFCGYTRDNKHSDLWLTRLCRGHVNRSAVASTRETGSSPSPHRQVHPRKPVLKRLWCCTVSGHRGPRFKWKEVWKPHRIKNGCGILKQIKKKKTLQCTYQVPKGRTWGSEI